MQLGVAVEKERQVLRLAGCHLESRYLWLSFLPAVLLTLMAGILAYAEGNGAASGIFATLAVFWQGTSQLFNYGVLAERCHAADDALFDIMEDLNGMFVASCTE